MRVGAPAERPLFVIEMHSCGKLLMVMLTNGCFQTIPKVARTFLYELLTSGVTYDTIILPCIK